MGESGYRRHSRTKDRADKRHSGTKISGEVLGEAQHHEVMRDDRLLRAGPSWKRRRAGPDRGPGHGEPIRAVKHGPM